MMHAARFWIGRVRKLARRSPRNPGLILAACLPVLLAGCGAAAGTMPLPVYALSGPPLIMLGNLNGEAFRGTMDRSCMVGFGGLELMSEAGELACAGRMDSPINQQGRVYAVLSCTDGSLLQISMRSLGPDQGFGVGRLVRKPAAGAEVPKEPGTYALMPLFYHCWAEEAERRFPAIDKSLRAVYEQNRGDLRGEF